MYADINLNMENNFLLIIENNFVLHIIIDMIVCIQFISALKSHL